MIVLLIAVPACAAVAAFFLRSDVVRRVLLLAAAALHAALVCWLWVDPAQFPPAGSWLAVDELGRIFLGITSALFLCVSVSAVGFLSRESGATRADAEEGFLFDNTPEALFTACLLGFLAAMTLVTASQHFGLLWVAIEATTLVSAPLIHYHRHHRSLEATWKYLLICSVGIAVALLGTYFLAASVRSAATGAHPAHLFAVWRPTPAFWSRAGSRPLSCCCWWATAPRWGLRRCTRGFPTRTARRRPSFRRCSRGPF